MKKTYSKTFIFRGLTVSISIDDIFIIYKAKNRIYFYKFKKNPFADIDRKVLVAIPAFLLIMTLLMLFAPGNKSDKALTDDEIKEALIKSSGTDYSEPVKSLELKIRLHNVKKGETLGQIAREYAVSIDTICGSNKLVSYDLVSEGLLLKIPNKDGILCPVKKGENIASLSRLYKIPVQKIISENSIKNYDFVAAGRDIFIPDAKPVNIFPGWIWPAYNRIITSGYGWRRDPINRSEFGFHSGIDIRINYAWVRAAKYGKVTYTGWLGGYGKTVIIAHPGGWKSIYGHLSRIDVRKDQYVKQGQYIAKSGNTGYSTGAHLHFELIKDGKCLNPYKYIK